jgi:hypothetical protein
MYKQCVDHDLLYDARIIAKTSSHASPISHIVENSFLFVVQSAKSKLQKIHEIELFGIDFESDSNTMANII